ncbi:hypothetical protein LTR86_005373 [Recurvomyces mirabilis]|nr:hypothetical protein LTR86_005373 [Recurvomyces mirabilis]
MSKRAGPSETGSPEHSPRTSSRPAKRARLPSAIAPPVRTPHTPVSRDPLVQYPSADEFARMLADLARENARTHGGITTETDDGSLHASEIGDAALDYAEGLFQTDRSHRGQAASTQSYSSNYDTNARFQPRNVVHSSTPPFTQQSTSDDEVLGHSMAAQQQQRGHMFQNHRRLNRVRDSVVPSRSDRTHSTMQSTPSHPPTSFGSDSQSHYSPSTSHQDHIPRTTTLLQPTVQQRSTVDGTYSTSALPYSQVTGDGAHMNGHGAQTDSPQVQAPPGYQLGFFGTHMPHRSPLSHLGSSTHVRSPYPPIVDNASLTAIGPNSQSHGNGRSRVQDEYSSLYHRTPSTLPTHHSPSAPHGRLYQHAESAQAQPFGFPSYTHHANAGAPSPRQPAAAPILAPSAPAPGFGAGPANLSPFALGQYQNTGPITTVAAPTMLPPPHPFNYQQKVNVAHSKAPHDIRTVNGRRLLVKWKKGTYICTQSTRSWAPTQQVRIPTPGRQSE